MATVIGIAGSPRRHGNSATLMRAALAGAESNGATTTEVYLNGLAYQGCQGCLRCRGGGDCILDDELSPHLHTLRSAQGWVLATPIYYDGCSGQFKSFFDRCRTFTHKPHSTDIDPQLEGPRGAIIIATYEDKERADYLRAMRVFAGYLSWMGDFGDVEVLCEGGLDAPESILGRPELISRATSLGERLLAGVR